MNLKVGARIGGKEKMGLWKPLPEKVWSHVPFSGKELVILEAILSCSSCISS